MNDRIIYQLFLRPFTPEGTLAAATKKLSHISSLGVNTVYLTSCCKADNDCNEAHFSPRQKASKTGNPKNPYRISDYYTLDEEYGTLDDLKKFVNTAHEFNLDVLFDVVFLHCGPSAVFLEDHRDFVKRDENGNIVCNAWCFPEINFESAELRRYLIDNMKFWITECDFDGFRCDVGDQIPLDFWSEAKDELQKIKPSLYMLNEGVKSEYTNTVFDSNYNFLWTHALQAAIRAQSPTSFIRKTDEDCRKSYASLPYVCLRALETHDYANDHYENRPDKALPSKAAYCAHLINLMMDGIPVIYNGNEIADGSRHSIWGNRDFGRFCIDWTKADTPDGKARLEAIKNAISIRKSNKWLLDAKTIWLDNSQSDKIVSFAREGSNLAFVVVANLRNEDVVAEITLPFVCKNDICVMYGDAECFAINNSISVVAQAYGFAIISIKF